MGEEPSRCASAKKDEGSKIGKNPEDKSSWLGPVNKNKDQDEKESDSRKVALEPPQQDSSVSKARSYLPPSPSQAQKPAMSKFGTIEVERDVVDKGMAAFVDEAAEKTIFELQNEPWYHGSLPLEDIGALVAAQGDFLLRELEPEEGRAPMPCLTVRLETQLKDYPIHTVHAEDSRLYTIDGTNKATTVMGLVQKHYEQKIPLPDEILLVNPIPKQRWELTKDKITLLTKLGEGAFGEVWQGTLRQSATQTVSAAIKVTKLKEDNKKYMQELFKEARLMRQYQHVNVVAFFGMVMENDNVMIVMEMVNGGGLDHYLKKNTVSIPDKCSYAFDVALGLYYLHSKRCMHRDLACRNCLIDTQKNIVKISDFGLSKQADSYKIQPNEKIPTKWQAPEVLATHIYTRECDVYSYGILVWEIFNDAKMPFEEYDNKTVRQRLSDPTFRPHLAEDLPDEIRVVVTACWAAAPDSRPVMKDVAWILKGFQKHNTTEQTVKQPTPPTPAANPATAPAAPAPKAQTPKPAQTPTSPQPLPNLGRPPPPPPTPPSHPPPPPPPPPLQAVPAAPVVAAKVAKQVPPQRKAVPKGSTQQLKPTQPPSRAISSKKTVRKDVETGRRRR